MDHKTEKRQTKGGQDQWNVEKEEEIGDGPAYARPKKGKQDGERT